jgi:hypothetical protein
MSAVPHARSPLLSIYNAALTCRGFVLFRGRGGYEAYDFNTKSIGVFLTQQEAINAVFAKAGAHHDHG